MSNKDYYSPILCLGAKQRTPSPSSVGFHDMPGKIWTGISAVRIGNSILTSSVPRPGIAVSQVERLVLPGRLSARHGGLEQACTCTQRMRDRV